VVGIRADQIHPDEAPANRLTFLIDTSGSMHSANKLPLLKRSFIALVEQLRPQDQVAIVTYAGSAGLVLPPTSADNKGEIYAALNRLRSGGSTAGGAGIQLAYKTAAEQFAKHANNRVLIATDGDFNVGQSSDGELVKMIEGRRDKGIFLTVMGFGQGNYQDAKMQKIAGHGNGVHYYIDSDIEAKRVFVDKLTSTLVTVAKDAKIQIEWNPERVAGYRLLGYENRILASEDFTDDKKDAGDLGAGHTVTAIYEIIPRGLNENVPASALRYQASKSMNSNQSEIAWLKFRYKEPLAATSKLFEQAIKIPSNWQPQKPSANFQWAVAAAEFGMLLRNSENAGDASWGGLQKRLSEIPAAYRATPIRREFVRLVQSSASLYQNDVVAWSPQD
jgi:Ca-activated chloride channel family protein